MQVLLDRSLLHHLKKFRPLLLDLSEDEMRHYLSLLPADSRALLTQRGLGRLLPSGLRRALLPAGGAAAASAAAWNKRGASGVLQDGAAAAVPPVAAPLLVRRGSSDSGDSAPSTPVARRGSGDAADGPGLAGALPRAVSELPDGGGEDGLPPRRVAVGAAAAAAAALPEEEEEATEAQTGAGSAGALDRFTGEALGSAGTAQLLVGEEGEEGSSLTGHAHALALQSMGGDTDW